MNRLREILAVLIWCSALAASGGTLDKSADPALSNLNEIIFCSRPVNPTDGHWYANFGYYANDATRKAWREGTRLTCLDLRTGKLRHLLDDARGGIRDPQVNYEGTKILFSYRKGGTENYLLYEINADGSDLRQLTAGKYDDFEPTYLPDGDIVFVSSRCKRWVNCWLTQVATLHRCDANGRNIHPISSNNEHDNTPWPLPDGRLIYTRWEYIDRSQVDYHHLWATSPDGTGQMVYYGNLHPGILMIDAKPIPGTDKVIAIFSPGHGAREHAGALTVVDPKAGPDRQEFARAITKGGDYRDPWAFSEKTFMAAQGPALVFLDAAGARQEIYRLSPEEIKAGRLLHEPRPLIPRPREPVLVDRTEPTQPTGTLLLSDVYEGRNMEGIKRGEIKKLLVLESLPMPIHYTGGMEPLSYVGTFTLERILGTVPVEPDGSAHIELPALRSFFFVALDENDLAVKRMHSFLTVQPGETTSCVGCHEQRTRAPIPMPLITPAAFQRPASVVEPVREVPQVLDFPRDIQPILNRLCVDCHGWDKTERGGPRAGKLVLSGDHGPMYSHGYYMLCISGLFSDNRNQPRSSYAPRKIGSSASRLLKLVDGSHYDAKATDQEKTLLRLWIDSGAAYPGTYAGLGTGMIGGYEENNVVHGDMEWPATKAAAAVLQKDCVGCHNTPQRVLPLALSDERGVSFWRPDLNDPRLLTSRHIVFNLSQPKKSMLLLAPLSRADGGWGLCGDPAKAAADRDGVLRNRSDSNYQVLLEFLRAGQTYLAEHKRFDMPGFVPRADWLREMKRYGILAAGFPENSKVDFYAIEEDYWQSLHYQPPFRVERRGGGVPMRPATRP